MCGGSRRETAVAVSSVAFNMAGPYSKRRAYVPTQTVGAVVSSQPSIPGYVNESLLSGPGIRLKAFARWARTSNYRAVIGTPSGRLNTVGQIDPQLIADYIQQNIKEPIIVVRADVQNDSVGYWVLKYVLTNYPERANSDYAYSYNVNTHVATITWTDNTTTQTTIPDPTGNKRFLMALYATLGPVVALDDPEPIPEYIVPEGENYPSEVLNWKEDSHTSSTETQTLFTKLDVNVKYSDGRPEEDSSSTTSVDENFTKDLYTRSLVKQWPEPPDSEGNVAFKWYSKIYNCVETYVVKPIQTVEVVTETIAGGVVKTTTTTTTVDTLVKQLSFTGSSTLVQPRYYDAYHLWEYRLGTGKPELDALFVQGSVEGDYVPFIPVRIQKRFVSSQYPNTIFPQVKKAVRRVYDSRYIELEKNLAKNEGIDDIDYAYVTFGASINSRSIAIKKYLFEYFYQLYNSYNASNPQTFESWQRQWDAAYASQQRLQDWYDRNPYYGNWYRSSPRGIEVVPYPSGATFEIEINSSNMTVLNYDQKISGQIVSLTTGTGLGWPGAKAGEANVINLGESTGTEPFYAISAETKADAEAARDVLGIINSPWEWIDRPDASNVAIIKQVTPNNWQKIIIKDFFFVDRIYHGNYDRGSPEVTIGVKEAFADADDSPFIIPFHEAILNSMSIVDYTEAASNGVFMLCNAYKTERYKVKRGGFFSFIVSIIVVVIAVVVTVFAPQLAPTMVKAAGATGAALGLTGTAALVAGAAVNAIAGMVISMLITEIATGVFGQKLGSIIGAVASYITLNMASSALSGSPNIFNSTDKLFSAANVLEFTSAVGKGWQGYNVGVAEDIQRDIQGVVNDTESLNKIFENKLLEIQNRYADLLGTKRGVIDTLQITATFGLTQDPTESRDIFLQRTLLTGSDIAEITNGYVTNFVETHLNLKYAINGA